MIYVSDQTNIFIICDIFSNNKRKRKKILLHDKKLTDGKIKQPLPNSKIQNRKMRDHKMPNTKLTVPDASKSSADHWKHQKTN